MAGKRIYELDFEQGDAQLDTNFNTLELVCDDPAFSGSDAQKLKVSTLLGGVRTRVYEIGSWDMTSATGTAGPISIDVSDIGIDNIVSFKAIIRSDDDYTITYTAKFDITEGGTVRLIYDSSNGDENISLLRSTPSDFDSIGFNNTSINRGHVVIQYIP